MEELERMMDDIMGGIFELGFYYDLTLYAGAMYGVVRNEDNIGATRKEVIKATKGLVEFAEELYNSGTGNQKIGESMLEVFMERGIEYIINSCKNQNYYVIEELVGIARNQNLKNEYYILIDYFRKYFVGYIKKNELDLYLEFML